MNASKMNLVFFKVTELSTGALSPASPRADPISE